MTKIVEKTKLEKQPISVTKYEKYGYEIRKYENGRYELEDMSIFMIDGAYTLKNGDYIGSEATAKFLCEKLGVLPQKRDKKHGVCSIGYSKKDKKWYGWSHRAYHGFGIGSKVKLGDCAFQPSNREEFINSIKSFWDFENKYNFEIDGDIIIRTGDFVSGLRDETIIPTEFSGRGEWEAKTLEDAKQMAIDFAESVS